MNWVDRYVAAVERYLPAASREDVGEEIRSLLEEKLADAEKAKGASLEEAEVLVQIRELGHPLQVASRYGDQRALVSAALFPVYRRAVKYLFLAVLVLLVLAGVVSASGLVSWWPADIGERIQMVGWWWLGLLTAAFYFADDLLQARLFDRWDPRRLPGIERGARIPLTESVVALLFCSLWFAILAALSHDYSWEAVVGRSETPWATTILYAKFHVLMVMGLNAAALFRPWWSRAKLVFKAVTDLLLAGVALWAFLHEGMWWPVQSVLLACVIAGLLGVAGTLSALSRFGRSPAPPTNWLDGQLRKVVVRSLPADLGRKAGADVARKVSGGLRR